MNDVIRYYDDMADASYSTRRAIESLRLAKECVQESLRTIKASKKYGDTTISAVSSVTTNDVRRELLFLELLLNQTFGVTNTLVFQELLELTDYSIDEEEP